MYYDPNYINWGRQGWTCPKCGRVYSPDTPQCWYCNGGVKTMPSTTATPEWVYREDTSTGKVINDWWNHPSSISWENMMRRTGLLEDD